MRHVRLRVLPIASLIAASVALTAAGCATASGGAAAAKGPGDATVSPAAQAAQDLAMAHQLAAYGERANDALALATAAQIVINTPVADLNVEPEARPGAAAAPAGSKGPAETEELDATDLLADARRAAAGNNEVLALIGRVEARAQTARRGAVGGAREAYEVVEAGNTHVYNITFRGGEFAMVYIDGDDDTDLDLYIYDDRGYLIDSSISIFDEEFIEWVPRYTGNFRIEVRNLDNLWNAYYLLTN